MNGRRIRTISHSPPAQTRPLSAQCIARSLTDSGGECLLERCDVAATDTRQATVGTQAGNPGGVQGGGGVRVVPVKVLGHDADAAVAVERYLALLAKESGSHRRETIGMPINPQQGTPAKAATYLAKRKNLARVTKHRVGVVHKVVADNWPMQGK